MSASDKNAASFWMGKWGAALLPVADDMSAEQASDRLKRLLRLSLFQVSVGMAMVLLTGTLNRVMIVELQVPAYLVALMVALPLVFAPLRALIGFRSDSYRSALGWRRVPFIWFGTLMQFGGLAIMPFALFILSGDTHGPLVVGKIAAALAFLLVGAGMHTTQTAGLALATDIADEKQRPQVVALLFVALLIGMLISALAFGVLLQDFTQILLIKVIQGAAMVGWILNVIALWKQEERQKEYTKPLAERPSFIEAWRDLTSDKHCSRVLVALAIGTLGFTMQDILLEPYGALVLGLSVSATTALTALHAGGMLAAFIAAANLLRSGSDPHRLAGYGALVGVVGFALVALVAALPLVLLFRAGVIAIGFGAGLFSVGMLSATMNLVRDGGSGLALGAWGAVQATGAGLAVALGGIASDTINAIANQGWLGTTLQHPATGFSVVYQIEIFLLFATLVAIGPLAKHRGQPAEEGSKFGLAEIPN